MVNVLFGRLYVLSFFFSLLVIVCWLLTPGLRNACDELIYIYIKCKTAQKDKKKKEIIYMHVGPLTAFAKKETPGLTCHLSSVIIYGAEYFSN